MDTMRKLTVLVIFAVLIAACGGSDQTADTGADAGDGTAETDQAATADGDGVAAWLEAVRAEHEGEEVVVLMASHPSTTAFQEIVTPFEEATGVTVSFDVLEEGAMVEKNLLECSSESDTYDVWMIAVEGVARMSETGCAAPLNDRIAEAPEFFDAEDLMPAYRELMENNDEAWAVPFAGESVFLMYRKDLFDEAGVEVPQTWEELRDVAARFHEGDVAGVSFRARRGWEFTYEYSVFLFPFGGMILDPETGEPAIGEQGAVDALEYMTSLKEYAPVGIEGFSFPEAWQAMQTGQVAMAVEATAAAPEIEDPEQSIVSGNVGYAPLPEGPEGAYTGVWGWGLGVNGFTEKKDVAWDVITWLTSRHTHQDYVDAGGTTSRASAFQDPANRETYPFYEAVEQALEQAEALTAEGLSVVPKDRNWHLYSESIGNYGAQAFAGQMGAQEAVEQMQAEMEDIAAGDG